MRKHVTPAHPRATISDPSRGRPLPAEGAPIEWSAYWARLENRGDVTVSEIPEAGDATAEPAPPTPAPEPAPSSEGDRHG